MHDSPALPILKRRDFLVASGAAALAGASLSTSAAVGADETPPAEETKPAWKFREIPNFCAHEHWGSIASIGRSGGGFRADSEQGATPNRRTGLLDILLDPYIGMTLSAAGIHPDEAARRAGAKDIHDLAARSIVAAMKILRPLMRPFRLVGTYQCIRQGLLHLYGIDLESPDDEAIRQLDAAIAKNYQDMFAWYPRAMRKTQFTELIRPMQLEYFVRKQSPETAAAEARFTHTLVRVDPFLQFWRKKSPHREMWATILDVDPVDAKSWRQFLGAFFDMAAKQGTLGIKQMQAYSRPLDFRPVADKDAIFRGDLNDAQTRVFQDWVMNECCRQAHERGWPHHIHVGTHNLPDSRPRPLGDLAARHPRMKIVMLHCWPYLKEAGWLAEEYANIYIDTNSLPLHGAGYFTEALRGWLNFIPTDKLMCSHDGTSVEMAAGSAVCTRKVLARVLREQGENYGFTERDQARVAADLLQNNSVAVYGIGKRFEV